MPSLPILSILLLLPLPILLLPRLPTWIRTLKSTLLQSLPHTSAKDKDSSEIVSLRIYPIKSCRGLQLRTTTLRKTGLDLDRRWMLVDAESKEFLTIRQIPRMTLINTALEDGDGEEGEMLVISIKPDDGDDSGDGGDGGEIRIPARPSSTWLESNTSLTEVSIWDAPTDAYIYSSSINTLFSTFLNRPVCLVYKGPTPRILRGNGDPALLGRTQNTNFPDVHPVLVASETSISELNKRLVAKGEKPISIERFRPNIVVKGNNPWTEDSWKLVRISSSADGSDGQSPTTEEKYLDLDVVARCARCQVPNVNPDTAEKNAREPWDTLVSYRRVDEGIKFKPCFGMLCAPRSEGSVANGMRFEVVEETKRHRYIKGF